MSTLRFSDRANFVELAVAIEEGTPYAVGDPLVTIKVQSARFVGHNDVWICAKEVRVFCIALAALDQTFRGEAFLVSASPHELELRIASAGLLGHMAVFGNTGCRVRTCSRRTYWHAVRFGFEFEPQQLAIAVATPWVQRSLAISGSSDT